jgi:hypothetical protein
MIFVIMGIVFKFSLAFVGMVYSVYSFASEDNAVSIGLGQTSSDYFANGLSPIRPQSRSISYSRQLNDNWMVDAGFEWVEGDGQWLSRDGGLLDRYEQAETQANAINLAAVWQRESYGLGISFASIKSEERSLSLQPAVFETLSSSDKGINFSVVKSIEFSQNPNGDRLSLDWSLGLQYAMFDIKILDRVNTKPPTNVNTNINQTSLSAYVDIEISYWIENSYFAWSPFFSVGWNTSISESGEQLILISRGDVERVVDRPSARFNSSIKIPNAGIWEMGISVMWDAGWMARLNYSQDIATEFDLQRINLEISTFF